MRSIKKLAESDMTLAATYMNAIKIRSSTVSRHSDASPAQRVAAESEEQQNECEMSF